MDLLLIVRDGFASSVAGNVILALRAREAGQKVGILMTQEALAAVAGGVLAWPRELAGQQMRLTMADRGGKAGLPLLGRGEGRQLDTKALLARAAEAGVSLYACPMWTELLALEGKLPDELQQTDANALLDLLSKAKTVVGSL
jgi:peroxiredoxin family protein